MPHGLLKDFKSLFSLIASIELGQLKAFAVSFAEAKVFEYIEYLKTQCPPPEVLRQMGVVLQKIYKLMDAFDKKIELIDRLPRLLEPPIRAGRIIVDILAHIPIPVSFPFTPGLPLGVINAISNLLVFLRKMVEAFESDIQLIRSILNQARGVFNPLRARLAGLEGILQRCAETPKYAGGSGETWGRLKGSAPVPDLLATLNLSGSNALPPGSTFPVRPGSITIGDARMIITEFYTGSFTPGSFPLLKPLSAVTSGTNINSTQTGNNTGTGVGSNKGNNTVTLIGQDGTSIILGSDDTVVGVTPSPSRTIIGGGARTNPNGTFIPNTQSSTGGANTSTVGRVIPGGNSDTGLDSGVFLPGIGSRLDFNTITNPEIGFIPERAFIDGTPTGFTPDERIGLIAEIQGNVKANTPKFEDVSYKARNGNTYTLSIQIDETSDFVAPKRYAVAKDFRGIVVLQGPKSFASSPQVLIDELKFRIDRQLP